MKRGQMTWLQTKQIVFAQHNCMCAECGTTKQLEVHHIVPIAKGGGDELFNLVLLCKSCHKKEETNPFRLDIKGHAIKISWKSYDWLTKQSKGYGDTMEDIVSRFIIEAEDYRRTAKK